MGGVFKKQLSIPYRLRSQTFDHMLIAFFLRCLSPKPSKAFYQIKTLSHLNTCTSQITDRFRASSDIRNCF